MRAAATTVSVIDFDVLTLTIPIRGMRGLTLDGALATVTTRLTAGNMSATVGTIHGLNPHIDTHKYIIFITLWKLEVD
ncbi:hypothetical protein CXF35_01665 [Corynebacterium bovis]|nr:hypothetical protein CXF40_06380 [Corynebacterium bovis]RRO98580.1 hypothetical protein CXF32_00550 [Corynebacterium bovis]RRQ00871.1 hypothetical protein CXF41_05760 [Corynebacterium bovis]RRQ03880.1 hypothetical protein CXF39_03180 [Corynebacterium bovis]RRQ08399.1 hypothetical protein CXF43_01095 [Corynebacterium bovis]